MIGIVVWKKINQMEGTYNIIYGILCMSKETIDYTYFWLR